MQIDEEENKRRMARGDLYYAFSPELIAARARCAQALNKYNDAGDVSRRRLTELWRDVTGDKTPLPPQAATPEEDDKLFEHDPWITPPVRMDYGTNCRFGQDVFINHNNVFVDTCLINIGSRCLTGPNVQFYSGAHPLDPVIRNGYRGPETGKEIHIGEDCWIGGNAVILAGVTLGRGCVVGAGSVVTKSVPAFHVVAGNPARILRKIETQMDPEQSGKEWQGWPEDQVQGAEKPMAEMVEDR